jgi:Tol biopolymer transport system component
MNKLHNYSVIFLILILMESLLGKVPFLSAQSGPLNGSGGGIVAFISNREENREIYLMNADGSEQTRVTNDGAFKFGLSWSPDGNRLAFCSSLHGGFEIYIMDVIDITSASFSPPIRITNNSAMEMSPTWSPNGLKIAYDSGMSGIAIMDIDGSNISFLNTSPINGSQPAWSPNGDRIAFSSMQGIYTIDIDGTDLHQVTSTYSLVPSWSPNANKIAYVGVNESEDIYIINTDGTENICITTSPENDFVPSWSPDGGRIVYEGSINVNDEICVIDINGENYQRLTNVGSNTGPCWRPIYGNTSVINNTSTKTATGFYLYQNYPNPFNPNTKIKYSLTQPAFTKLVIFNILGEKIIDLVNEYKNIGVYEAQFNSSNLPSGVYFYLLQSGSQVQHRSMLLTK